MEVLLSIHSRHGTGQLQIMLLLQDFERFSNVIHVEAGTMHCNGAPLHLSLVYKSSLPQSDFRLQNISLQTLYLGL
jgi:hypothetical protein